MKRSSLWYLLGSVFNRRLLFFSAFGRRLKIEQPQAETKTQCAGAKILSRLSFAFNARLRYLFHSFSSFFSFLTIDLFFVSWSSMVKRKMKENWQKTDRLKEPRTRSVFLSKSLISSLILFCRCPKEIPTAEQEKKRSKLRLTKDEPSEIQTRRRQCTIDDPWVH